MASKETGDQEVEVTELVDYDDENTGDNLPNKRNHTAKQDQDTHVAAHSTSFEDFYLKPELLKAIRECGFEHPSEVQENVLPQAILGTDVLCQAKSGMGKTAVFVLAVLHQLDFTEPTTFPKCLVLGHTRELAYQIAAEFERFKKYLPCRTAVFYGGVPIEEHKKLLKENNPQIVIGTPGRILELTNDSSLKLKQIQIFVVDECDKMLGRVDMRADLQKIFLQTPVQKQAMMFSATIDKNLRDVCKKYMYNPIEIFLSDQEIILHGLTQYYTVVEEKKKTKTLVELLDNVDFQQVIIFVKSPARATELNKILNECNFPSETMHSRMPAQQRTTIFEKVKNFQCRVIVATNLVARGIDIVKTNVVINYDFPENPDTYLHRVGRAGRFGTKGLCISFVAQGNQKDAHVLEEVQKRFEIKIPTLPDHIDSSTYSNS